jgi:NAD(P)-dependent dehydrogenase (short-subunit alcohol dehydrogenase family)
MALVELAFAAIHEEFGPVDALIYNAGSGVWGSVEETRPEDFESTWRINAFGAFIAARQVIPRMKAAGHGTIVFIGATASRRGGAKTAAFASAKAAQRSLAESLARSLGPLGMALSHCWKKNTRILCLQHFQATATASRHAFIAAARKARCVLAEMR